MPGIRDSEKKIHDKGEKKWLLFGLSLVSANQKCTYIAEIFNFP